MVWARTRCGNRPTVATLARQETYQFRQRQVNSDQMLKTSADPQLQGPSPEVEAAYRDVRAQLDPTAAEA